MSTTKVYEALPGREPRLMNTIGAGSRFRSMPWTCRAQTTMSDPDNQRRAAEEIVQGWRQNGNKPEARYFYVQA